MRMYQFDTEINQIHHNQPHHLRVLGYWERTDGDHIVPAQWKFFPEEVWVVRHGHTKQEQTRLLPDQYRANNRLWNELADQGDIVWADMQEAGKLNDTGSTL